MGLFDWIRLIILSLLWGGSYIWIEIALLTISPLMIVFFRVFMASIFLLSVCKILKLSFVINKRLFIIFLMMSLFNNVIPFNLIAWGQSQITASVSSILNATTPLFTVILAHYWPKGEKATLYRIIGVDVGDDLNNSIDGQIAILLASVSYAISVLFGKQIDSSIHPAISATMMLCISSIILMPIVIYMGVDFIEVSKIESIIPLLGLSIFSTAIAYLIFYKLIKNIGSNVMLVTLLMPISAIFMSIIFLGESIATQHIIGLILILIGLILVDGRILQRFR